MRVLNLRLFWSLVLFYLVPNLYLILRIHFFRDIPNDLGINIASQLSWVNLLYEVAHEALLLPLYFLIGKSINNFAEFRNKVCSGYIVILLIYSIISVIISIFAEPLCEMMAQKSELITISVCYIRLETVASIFATILKYSLLLLVLLNRSKFMYFIVALQVCLAMIFDTFFISQFSFSMTFGVNGIAISNILTNALSLSVTILYINKQFKLSFKKLSYGWIKEWIDIGKYSGLESLVRNLSFSLMIIRMVNVVQEQGNYWIANNFIWGFLLVPVLALSEIIKREAGENFNTMRKQMPIYFKINFIIIGFWLLSIPLWQFFIKEIMNVQDFKTVQWLVCFQLPFYIVFTFNCILTAVLYGRGKTKYLFYKSVYIDIFYYGLVFILYINEVFIPSLKIISLIFGCGIILSNIPTIYFYRKTVKQQ